MVYKVLVLLVRQCDCCYSENLSEAQVVLFLCITSKDTVT